MVQWIDVLDRRTCWSGRSQDNFTLEVFQLSSDPFDQERFARRVRIPVPVLDRIVSVPTAEDVIIIKLRWSRPKDLDDALGSWLFSVTGLTGLTSKSGRPLTERVTDLKC